jgi:3-oxoacyl-[acyl-carrier-protein] synthase II
VAAAEALADAGLDGQAVDGERAAVVLGCGRGGLPAVEEAAVRYAARGVRGVSPHFSVLTLASMAAAQIARTRGFTGPCLGIATACASGTHAIAEAAHLIRRGEADVVVTGGSEAVITPLMLSGFHQARVLAPAGDDPPRACRPFDRSRRGFVLGEGACCLVVESQAHARARGARVYGAVAGSGMTCDAYHPTTPDPEGRALARAITHALRAAGVTARDLDYISAHGTGTLHNDPTESRALHVALGSAAETIRISSIKGATGHMLGASGALEAAICLLAMRDGVAPATANLTDPDPACALAHVVGAPLHGDYRLALSHSAGFGGVNAALVLQHH